MVDESKEVRTDDENVRNGMGGDAFARELSEADEGRELKGGATVSHVLGEMVRLLTQSRPHRKFSIGDLEWMVMPAIQNNQFRIFRNDQTPLGFALWAYVSQEVEQRLRRSAKTELGVKMGVNEWKSGDKLWLIELVSPFATSENKLVEAMLIDLAQNVFPGRTFKFLVGDAAGGEKKVEVFGV